MNTSVWPKSVMGVGSPPQQRAKRRAALVQGARGADRSPRSTWGSAAAGADWRSSCGSPCCRRRGSGSTRTRTRSSRLERLDEQLVVRLRMFARRADCRRVGTLMDVAAVAALPADGRLSAEDASALDVREQLAVARLVVRLDLRDLAERRR